MVDIEDLKEFAKKAVQGSRAKADKLSMDLIGVHPTQIENFLSREIRHGNLLSLGNDELVKLAKLYPGLRKQIMYRKPELKMEKKESDPSLKPPKEWFDKMAKGIKKANPDYSDEQVRATIGSIWYHELGTKKKKKIRGREGKTYGKAEDKEMDFMNEQDGDLIKRTTTITVPTKDLAVALGYGKNSEYPFDADPYDDVYHGGYSESDILKGHYDLGKYDEAEKLFSSQVAMVMEDVERSAIASAITKSNIEAFENALEMIHVPGEYQDADGNMVSAGGAGIEDAEVSQDTTEVTLKIKNPEHLINDIMAGRGFYSAEFSSREAASDDEIKKKIHIIADYFEVYGERKPSGELDSRYTPDWDSKQFEEELAFRIEEMPLDEIADAVIEAVDAGRLESENEAINLASKFTKEKKKDIVAAVKQELKKKGEKLSSRMSGIKEEQGSDIGKSKLVSMLKKLDMQFHRYLEKNGIDLPEGQDSINFKIIGYEPSETREEDGKTYFYPEALHFNIESLDTHKLSLLADGKIIPEGATMTGKGISKSELFQMIGQNILDWNERIKKNKEKKESVQEDDEVKQTPDNWQGKDCENYDDSQDVCLDQVKESIDPGDLSIGDELTWDFSQPDVGLNHLITKGRILNIDDDKEEIEIQYSMYDNKPHHGVDTISFEYASEADYVEKMKKEGMDESQTEVKKGVKYISDLIQMYKKQGKRKEQILDLIDSEEVNDHLKEVLGLNFDDIAQVYEMAGEMLIEAKRDEVSSILLALNSLGSMGMKYPIGNPELTAKVKELEAIGKISYDKHYDKWVKGKKKFNESGENEGFIS